MIDCIVPAFNEEKTIGGVVDTLKRSGAFRSIVVVDDGSKDRTAAIALERGVPVLSLRPNRGKGEAMLAAVRRCSAPRIMFVDADLVGFEPKHVERLVAASNQGFDMVCGLREYGIMGNPLQAFGPLITGERIVKRWILEQLPATCWTGYSIETAMNHVCDRHGGSVCVVPMRGVRIRGKVKKFGVLDGLKGHWKMFGEIRRTRDALRSSGGASCKLGGG